jgi:hypothetical protein
MLAFGLLATGVAMIWCTSEGWWRKRVTAQLEEWNPGPSSQGRLQRAIRTWRVVGGALVAAGLLRLLL